MLEEGKRPVLVLMVPIILLPLFFDDIFVAEFESFKEHVLVVSVLFLFRCLSHGVACDKTYFRGC